MIGGEEMHLLAKIVVRIRERREPCVYERVSLCVASPFCAGFFVAQQLAFLVIPHGCFPINDCFRFGIIVCYLLVVGMNMGFLVINR